MARLNIRFVKNIPYRKNDETLGVTAVTGDQENEEERYVPYYFLNFLPFMRNRFSFTFLFVSFVCREL